MQYASFGVLSNYRAQQGKTSGQGFTDHVNTTGSIADMIYGKSIVLFVAHVLQSGSISFLPPLCHYLPITNTYSIVNITWTRVQSSSHCIMGK